MSASKWKPYPEYKTARLDWLGEIPTHWKTGRLKNILRLSTEKNGATPVGDMLSVSGYRGIETKIYDHEDQQRTDEDLKDYRVVRKGQLVVNTMWLNHSGLGVSDLEGHVSPAYRTYNIDENYFGKFLHHLVRSSTYVGHYCSLLYGIRPNSYQVKNHDWDSVELLIPPIQEQKDIAEFLNSFTEKVDYLIHELEQEKMLLEEKRLVLITQAVTKGLNPDVPMKDSGIAWIGEIPNHWQKNHLKRQFYFKKGRFGQLLTASFLEDSEAEYPVYSGQTKDGGVLGFWDEYEFEFPDGVIFSTTVGAKCMTTKWINGKFSLSQNCMIMIPKVVNIDSKYGEYFLRYYFLEEKKKLPAIMQPSLRFEDLNQFQILLPPIEEQRQISTHLDSVEKRIDGMKDSTNEQIKRLNEYQTALISAAVTGKIDIRESV